MSKLLFGTHYVLPDEPCLELKELNEPRPDSKGVHRYQTVVVVRNDKLVHYRRDLGPAKACTAVEFFMPGGMRDPDTGRIYIWETVGRLMEAADDERAGIYGRPDPPEGIDLIGGYYDSFDKKARRRKRQSTFGYGGVTQRS